MTILIPDIHGRAFWHDAIPFIEKGYRTIFLGDYLDEYRFESISREATLENFREILELAKRHPNIELLLGNHDCGYMFDLSVCNCRTDINHYGEIRSLFIQNRHLFKLCTTLGDGSIIASHAGINRRWIEKWSDALFEEGIPNYNQLCGRINKVLYEAGVYLPRCDIGPGRGGDANAGSIVWAHPDEYPGAHIPYDQIVGHTMQIFFTLDEQGNPIYERGSMVEVSDLFCIDTLMCYKLDDNMIPSPLSVLDTVVLDTVLPPIQYP